MATPYKIMHVVGARPNFVKVAPVLKEMKKFPQFEPILVHTGSTMTILCRRLSLMI